MTPQDFIAKWRNVELKERSASQSHFNDLCALLGVLDPIAADPTGDWFTFERGATKTGGGEGWADVWRRGAFAWEYKGPRKDLDRAFSQLLQYAVALENPPLLIVSDTNRIRIHTNWTNTVQEVHEFTTDELIDGAKRDALRRAFTDPEWFKPAKTRQALTEETAREFAGLAQRLRERGHEAHEVAHFINRLVFCMFAEDAGLLPDDLFTRMLERSRRRPESFVANARMIFAAMATGGSVGFEDVDWFNGGLFEDDRVLPVDADDIEQLLQAARRDWSQIDPAILGTLFERGLDPAKRSQLGAHYTDRAKIEMIVAPVIVRPLEAEWAEALGRITALIEAAPRRTAERLLSPAERRRRDKAFDAAGAIHAAFVDRLAAFRVLDPACGSGNFLYVALRALKDLEHRANLDAEALGLPRGFPRVGPECVLGIELNPYAAELARVSVWIGEIQWMRRNGFDAAKNPILRPLDTIECRDAVLANFNPPPQGGGGAEGVGGGGHATDDGGPPPPSGSAGHLPLAGEDGIPTRAHWPAADVVVGNPPFLGGKRLRSELGDKYVNALFGAYKGIVPQEADLVTYWIAKAWSAISAGSIAIAGLVTTNSVRGGANRQVLAPIADAAGFVEAWADQPWTVDGAAVRVSLIAFDAGSDRPALLEGAPVERINADLTGAVADLTKASRLLENTSVAFMGDTKGGSFDVPGSLAREWLGLPLNPNGRSNSDVLRPWVNGMDVTRRPSDKWIIDFGWNMPEHEAAFYEAPFGYVAEHVQPERIANRREAYARYWWRHVEPRQGMWKALKPLKRYIATPRVARHRIFLWLPTSTVPDSRLNAIARDDDTFFGLLHSRFHEAWSLRLGGWHGVGNDPQYTPSQGFETFPFPAGLTPDIPAIDYADDPRALAIAAAARRLDELREAWLNPPDLVVRTPEVVPGYPDRLLPVDDAAAAVLKTRTLTNLYNARPAWLANAHAALDQAVADAYGWGGDQRGGTLTDDEVLARLFALNQERAAAQGIRGT